MVPRALSPGALLGLVILITICALTALVRTTEAQYILEPGHLQRRGFFSFHANPAVTHAKPYKMQPQLHPPHGFGETGLFEKVLGSKTLEEVTKLSSKAANKAYRAIPQGLKKSVSRDAEMANGWFRQHTPGLIYKTGTTAIQGVTKMTNSMARATQGEMNKQQTRRIVRKMVQKDLVPPESVHYVGRKTDRAAFLHSLETGKPYYGPVSREASQMPGVFEVPRAFKPNINSNYYDPFGRGPGHAGWAAPRPDHHFNGAGSPQREHIESDGNFSPSQSTQSSGRHSVSFVEDVKAAPASPSPRYANRNRSPPPGGRSGRRGKAVFEQSDSLDQDSPHKRSNDLRDHYSPPVYDDLYYEHHHLGYGRT